MATDETLLQLALELAADYDGDLDTSAGSTFRTQFLDPLLQRAGGSPLDVDTESFLVQRLETEIPEVDTSPLSAMRDLAIRAFTLMVEPYRREINGVKTAQSLNNYLLMTRDEVDALLGNYFTQLRSGAKASGTARMYFPSPQSIIVTPTTQFSTGGGLNFFPSSVQSISNTQMSFQQEGELYYFDVLVQAENAGTEYNIDAEEISTVVGISGVTRVTNLRKFTSGLAEETKAEGVARTQNSITIRNLITSRGVSFVIPENFPAVDTLQVIGNGDPEMLRDIISGPVEISGIPGGYAGTNSADLGLGEFVHIGGKTDVYVYQAEPDVDDLDIENITDKGYRRHAGTTGFTDPSTPTTTTFQDEFGFFQTRAIAAGDVLLIGEDEFPITTVTDQFTLEVTGSIPGGLFSTTYEIVRRVSGQVTIPLYDLVAEDSSGNPVFNESGNPVAPIPGSPTYEELLDGSSVQVEKTENKASVNIPLPLLRIETVEFLDPLTLEASGQVVPMRDLLGAYSPTGMTGGDGITRASGTMRLYFRDAVNCFVTRASTRFTLNGRNYRPVAEFLGATLPNFASIPDENVDEIEIGGDVTGSIAVGDRIQFLSASPGNYFTVTAITLGGGVTTLTGREDLNDFFGSPLGATSDWSAHVGILEANMSQDAETGLYFFDIQVEDLISGSGGNQDANQQFAANNVNSEGWSLKSTESVHSYSTRDQPYFSITNWVNDTTRLFVTFTAPALRLSYEFASSIADIQDFADDDANRIVSEDVLIRHFLPAYVRSDWTVSGNITTTSAKDAIVAFINALDPTEDLEVSDLVDDLYAGGATKVMLPVTLVGLSQGRDRQWDLEFSEDALTSSRIQHYVADADFITVS